MHCTAACTVHRYLYLSLMLHQDYISPKEVIAWTKLCPSVFPLTSAVKGNKKDEDLQ